MNAIARLKFEFVYFETAVQHFSHYVMVNTLDCGIVVSEFEIQSFYYVHFWINGLGESMNPLILSAMGQIVPLLFF